MAPPSAESSARIIAWTLVWTVLLGAALEVAVRQGYPWRLTALEPFLLNGTADTWSHNLFTIERLNATETSEPVVLILGGSASLEAITTDREVEEGLRACLSRTLDVHSIASSYKTWTDESKIVEALRLDRPALILFPTDLMSFTKPPRVQLIKELEHRTLWKYPSLAPPPEVRATLTAASADLPGQTWLRLPNVTKVLGESVRSLVYRTLRRRPRATFERHAVGNMIPADAAKIEQQRGWVPRELARLEHQADLNVEIAALTFASALRRGARVMVVDLPTNPAVQDLVEPHEPRYRAAIDELTRRDGVTYLDARAPGDWRPEHFSDFHHLTSEGRGLLTTRLVDELCSSSAVRDALLR